MSVVVVFFVILVAIIGFIVYKIMRSNKVKNYKKEHKNDREVEVVANEIISLIADTDGQIYHFLDNNRKKNNVDVNFEYDGFTLKLREYGVDGYVGSMAISFDDLQISTRLFKKWECHAFCDLVFSQIWSKAHHIFSVTGPLGKSETSGTISKL